MITVRLYENKPYEVKNQKIDGFNVSCFMKSSVLGTRPTNVDVDFTKAFLKVILKRDDQQFILIQDNLKVLGLATNLTHSSVRAFYQDHVYATSLTLQEAGKYGESLLSFDIDLGGTLDLRNDDILYCELNIQNGFFSANVDINNAHVEFKARRSVGIERYVPKITSHVIQGGEMRKGFNLGNCITKIILLNFDKGYAYDAVVNSLILSSKQLDETYSFRDLVTSKTNSLPIMPFSVSDYGNETSYEYDQCFTIVDSVDLDEVSLDIQFNPANVAGNKNFVVVHSYYTDMKTLVQADAKAMQEQQEKLSALKQNQANAKL